MSTASSSLSGRVIRVMEDLRKDLPQGITDIEQVDAGNVSVWSALVHGPQGSPYEGGKFKILIEFPEEFPHKSPTIRFNPPLYHPNIYEDGKVNINQDDKTAWSALSVLGPVLSSLSPMLENPIVDAKPANQHAAALFSSDKQAFINKAKEMAKSSSQ